MAKKGKATKLKDLKSQKATKGGIGAARVSVGRNLVKKTKGFTPETF